MTVQTLLVGMASAWQTKAPEQMQQHVFTTVAVLRGLLVDILQHVIFNPQCGRFVWALHSLARKGGGGLQKTLKG